MNWAEELLALTTRIAFGQQATTRRTDLADRKNNETCSATSQEQTLLPNLSKQETGGRFHNGISCNEKCENKKKTGAKTELKPLKKRPFAPSSSVNEFPSYSITEKASIDTTNKVPVHLSKQSPFGESIDKTLRMLESSFPSTSTFVASPSPRIKKRMRMEKELASEDDKEYDKENIAKEDRHGLAPRNPKIPPPNTPINHSSLERRDKTKLIPPTIVNACDSKYFCNKQQLSPLPLDEKELFKNYKEIESLACQIHSTISYQSGESEDQENTSVMGADHEPEEIDEFCDTRSISQKSILSSIQPSRARSRASTLAARSELLDSNSDREYDENDNGYGGNNSVDSSDEEDEVWNEWRVEERLVMPQYSSLARLKEPIWSITGITQKCKVPSLALIYDLNLIRDENEAQTLYYEHCIWKYCLKEEKFYIPNPFYFGQHPDLTYKMRYILINWLIEVSLEFMLHREALHLAINYLDRFLSLTENVDRNSLQLIGISSLFIAAKLEEVYPPKLKYFEAVCDGACTADDILNVELQIMEILKWEIVPSTIPFWLNLYLQNAARWFPREFSNTASDGVASNHLKTSLSSYYSFLKEQEGIGRELIGAKSLNRSRFPSPTVHNFPGPLYRTAKYYSAISLLDVCIHDVESLAFSYSVMAASAFYIKCCHGVVEDPVAVVKLCTGYDVTQLSICIEWLSIFKDIPLLMDSPLPQLIHKIHPTDQHNIQLHNRSVLEYMNRLYEAELQDVGDELLSSSPLPPNYPSSTSTC